MVRLAEDDRGAVERHKCKRYVYVTLWRIHYFRLPALVRQNAALCAATKRERERERESKQ